MLFVFKSGLDLLMNTKTYQRVEEFNQRTQDLLEDRNKLADLMAGHLEVIAHAAERYKLADDKAV